MVFSRFELLLLALELFTGIISCILDSKCCWPLDGGPWIPGEEQETGFTMFLYPRFELLPENEVGVCQSSWFGPLTVFPRFELLLLALE